MWILILTLLTNNGAALTTAQFESKKACEVAGTTWQKDSEEWGFHVQGHWRCVSAYPPGHIYNK